MVKNLPVSARDVRKAGLIPGWGRSPQVGNGKSLQSSCLEISWTKVPGGLLSMGSQRVGHDRVHTHRVLNSGLFEPKS